MLSSLGDAPSLTGGPAATAAPSARLGTLDGAPSLTKPSGGSGLTGLGPGLGAAGGGSSALGPGLGGGGSGKVRGATSAFDFDLDDIVGGDSKKATSKKKDAAKKAKKAKKAKEAKKAAKKKSDDDEYDWDDDDDDDLPTTSASRTQSYSTSPVRNPGGGVRGSSSTFARTPVKEDDSFDHVPTPDPLFKDDGRKIDDDDNVFDEFASLGLKGMSGGGAAAGRRARAGRRAGGDGPTAEEEAAAKAAAEEETRRGRELELELERELEKERERQAAEEAGNNAGGASMLSVGASQDTVLHDTSAMSKVGAGGRISPASDPSDGSDGAGANKSANVNDRTASSGRTGSTDDTIGSMEREAMANARAAELQRQRALDDAAKAEADIVADATGVPSKHTTSAAPEPAPEPAAPAPAPTSVPSKITIKPARASSPDRRGVGMSLGVGEESMDSMASMEQSFDTMASNNEDDLLAMLDSGNANPVPARKKTRSSNPGSSPGAKSGGGSSAADSGAGGESSPAVAAAKSAVAAAAAAESSVVGGAVGGGFPSMLGMLGGGGQRQRRALSGDGGRPTTAPASSGQGGVGPIGSGPMRDSGMAKKKETAAFLVDQKFTVGAVTMSNDPATVAVTESSGPSIDDRLAQRLAQGGGSGGGSSATTGSGGVSAVTSSVGSSDPWGLLRVEREEKRRLESRCSDLQAELDATHGEVTRLRRLAESRWDQIQTMEAKLNAGGGASKVDQSMEGALFAGSGATGGVSAAALAEAERARREAESALASMRVELRMAKSASQGGDTMQQASADLIDSLKAKVQQKEAEMQAVRDTCAAEVSAVRAASSANVATASLGADLRRELALVKAQLDTAREEATAAREEARLARAAGAREEKARVREEMEHMKHIRDRDIGALKERHAEEIEQLMQQQVRALKAAEERTATGQALARAMSSVETSAAAVDTLQKKVKEEHLSSVEDRERMIKARERMLEEGELRVEATAKTLEAERLRLASLSSAVEESTAEMRKSNAEEKSRLRKEHQRLDALQAQLEAERQSMQDNMSRELRRLEETREIANRERVGNVDQVSEERRLLQEERTKLVVQQQDFARQEVESMRAQQERQARLEAGWSQLTKDRSEFDEARHAAQANIDEAREARLELAKLQETWETQGEAINKLAREVNRRAEAVAEAKEQADKDIQAAQELNEAARQSSQQNAAAQMRIQEHARALHEARKRFEQERLEFARERQAFAKEREERRRSLGPKNIVFNTRNVPSSSVTVGHATTSEGLKRVREEMVQRRNGGDASLSGGRNRSSARGRGHIRGARSGVLAEQARFLQQVQSSIDIAERNVIYEPSATVGHGPNRRVADINAAIAMANNNNNNNNNNNVDDERHHTQATARQTTDTDPTGHLQQQRHGGVLAGMQAGGETFTPGNSRGVTGRDAHGHVAHGVQNAASPAWSLPSQIQGVGGGTMDSPLTTLGTTIGGTTGAHGDGSSDGSGGSGGREPKDANQSNSLQPISMLDTLGGTTRMEGGGGAGLAGGGGRMDGYDDTADMQGSLAASSGPFVPMASQVTDPVQVDAPEPATEPAPAPAPAPALAPASQSSAFAAGFPSAVSDVHDHDHESDDKEKAVVVGTGAVVDHEDRYSEHSIIDGDVEADEDVASDPSLEEEEGEDLANFQYAPEPAAEASSPVPADAPMLPAVVASPAPSNAQIALTAALANATTDDEEDSDESDDEDVIEVLPAGGHGGDDDSDEDEGVEVFTEEDMDF